MKRAEGRTDTKGRRPLISGLTEMKGGCVLREDGRATRGARHADVLHGTRPHNRVVILGGSARSYLL